MLGPAQADALRAVLDGQRRVPAVVRVGPDPEPPDGVRAPQQPLEVTAGPRRDDVHRARVDDPAAAVDRDQVAFGQ